MTATPRPPSAASVGLARALMRLRERRPSTAFGDLGEVFNRREYLDAPPEAKAAMQLEFAENRYRGELAVPYASYFGPHDIGRYLRERDVLDFGCSQGALARSVIEHFRPRSLTGVDVDEERVAAARSSFAHLGLEATFITYDGRRLPFEDRTFDAVYSFDVLEHVSDLENAVAECFRVLRPGGRMLCVFPSWYHWTEHHLSLATGTPFFHYFFRPETLAAAYESVVGARGEEAYWYRRAQPAFEPWERSHTINGMTKRRFRKLVRSVGFEVEVDYPLAIFETGRLRRRAPVLGLAVPVFRVLGRLPVLEEFFNHRIVLVLRRP